MQLLKEKTRFTVTDFKRINKYQYANYKRDDEHGPRTYAVKDKKVPSVTTILAATQSEDNRKGLDVSAFHKINSIYIIQVCLRECPLYLTI